MNLEIPHLLITEVQVIQSFNSALSNAMGNHYEV
jgi:hypothetical protein